MIYTYNKDYWKTFSQGNNIEWVLTNGSGSYAGGSLIASKNRTHQGYLIASLCAPTCRYVCLEMVQEWVSIGDKVYDLETSAHRQETSTVLMEGQNYLDRVSYNGTVKFEYRLPEFFISKQIGLVRNRNIVVIDYVFNNNSKEDAVIILTPHFNFREHNELERKEDIDFDTIINGDTLSLVPNANQNVRIDFSVSEGTYYELQEKFDENFELQTEVDLETEGLNTHYRPYEISVEVAAGKEKRVSVVCSVIIDEKLSGLELLESAADAFVGENTAIKLLSKIEDYYESIEKNSGYQDEFAKKLVLDADHFVVNRKSTGMKTVLAGLPWFTDWGRDTMIAFTGLTLCTRRYEDAKEILKSFAKYVHKGMVPNMFPDDGSEPLYNTVDASLWYFYAVYKYLEYVKQDQRLDLNEKQEAESFIETEIYPILTQILKAYEEGTDFNIHMLSNGLINAGRGLDQVTWMDVRVGDLVVTPRHGCPIEINALWYNALRIGQEFAFTYGNKELSRHYRTIADKVSYSFTECFWNNEMEYLADVVSFEADGSVIQDMSLRPNQIYAVALPFSLLDKDKEKKIVDIVEQKLLIGCGLRSLSVDHKDYHGQYRGALQKRDLSYHQGTAWGFLLGGFISAYAKVYKPMGGTSIEETTKYKEKLLNLFEPVMKHQAGENCIGGICEIFEGDEPHTGRGCYTQAWSTGEILRAYVEEVVEYGE